MIPPETKAGLTAYFSRERNFDSSLTSLISNNPFIQNTDKIDTRETKVDESESSHYAIAWKLRLLMAEAVPKNASGISADDLGVQLRASSDALFEKGTAWFSGAAEIVLRETENILKEYNLYLVVRGHTDSSEAGPNFPSGCELSGARSAAVLRYLMDKGINQAGCVA